MRLLPHAVALFLMAASAALAAPAENILPITLDQVMAALRTVHHVDARYVEHRYLHILRDPIVMRGSLHFDAPDHLEKATDPAPGGAAEHLTIDGDKLTIDRGAGTRPMVLSLREHPEIGILAESVRATLSGDAATLNRLFDITPSGTMDHWLLVLQPRDTERRGQLQWIRVTGSAGRVTAIDTADGEGDRSDMAIVEQGP